MNPLVELEKFGQAPWLDYIRRNLLTSGELKKLVDNDGLRGVTSNPTIFEKAIAGSTDYDEALKAMISKSARTTTGELYEALAVEDIRHAADILRPVYDKTKGADGFVCLEVSPKLAHDTAKTIEEARRLWKAVGKPNVMIKVPGTKEGIPAIEQLIGEGINVNVTLMFSMAHYEAVAQAYVRGVNKCADPSKVNSVASFFVSRVDTAVDKALEAVGSPEAVALMGKAAIANSKLVYKRFKEIFYGDSFAALRKKGAKVQRPLWASTSTKNPAFSDVMYVEALIGKDTVDTLPPATLEAFRDHGKVAATVEQGLAQAEAELAALKKFKIDMNIVTEQLQVDGVISFAKSFDELMASLEKKAKAILAGAADSQTLSLGASEAKTKARLAQWQETHFADRMWRKDPLLWSAKPVGEIINRLGWLTLPEVMAKSIDDLTSFAKDVKAKGFKHAVVLGMGGSSLAPDVFHKMFGSAAGFPQLLVLDSTHPAAVRAVEKQIDPAKTLFIVSSKSGTTIEPNSFFDYFWARVSAVTKTPGDHFVAVTDPDTTLAKLGAERKFRRVFIAVPDVGGRYSALTMFGLVPAAVIGLDLKRLLDQALTMQKDCAPSVAEPQNPGLVLGAALGELALAGRDKVTFVTDAPLAAFPDWIEQLIAESTGKDDKGILPVAEETLGSPQSYGKDRVFVSVQLNGDAKLEKQLDALQTAGHPVIRMRLAEKADLGQEFFRWEFAIAAAGAVIGIHPFNQPDVELAKNLAREAMKRTAAGTGKAASSATPIASAGDAIKKLLGSIKPGDYFAIQAYLAPNAATTDALQKMRVTLRDRLQVATTLGYGPRFLHSTGQMHKGGPNTGVFLQLIDDPSEELPVPETDYSFAQLIRAQAKGDLQALQQRGRRVLEVNLGKDAKAGLARLVEAVSAALSVRT